MRVLVNTASQPYDEGATVPADEVAVLYAAPAPDWLRVNMVSTVDGAATGEDGLTGSVNNPADRQVFGTLRRMADAIVVGAGTARAERYRPTDRPTVVVSRRADVPTDLRGGPAGSVLLVTCESAEHLGQARELLGPEQVLVLGSRDVDLGSLRAAQAGRGWRDLLCEGGPHRRRALRDVGPTAGRRGGPADRGRRRARRTPRPAAAPRAGRHAAGAVVRQLTTRGTAHCHRATQYCTPYGSSS